jgi:integrase/recombinase XerD
MTVVTIVTRHSADCPWVGVEQHKKCGCWKHLRYRENGKLKWKATKETTWAGAERYKMNFLMSRDPVHAAKTQAQTQAQITVRAALTSFLESKKGEKVKASTLGIYTLQLTRLRDYLEAHDAALLAAVTVPLLTSFRTTWLEQYPSDSTRYLAQARLRTFFKYATRAYRLAYNPMPDLSPIKPHHIQTKPFEPAEYTRILTTVATMFQTPRHRFLRTRERSTALIELMRHSGLAIQDALCLPRAALQKDHTGYRIVTSRVKTGVGVSVPIPSAVAERLLALPEGGEHFLWNGRDARVNAVHRAQDHLKRIFRRAKMPDAHTHMLRDTAAVEWLKIGLSLWEVSKLLGHTSVETTEKYYASWVQGLQDNMEAKIRAHSATTPPLTRAETTS